MENNKETLIDEIMLSLSALQDLLPHQAVKIDSEQFQHVTAVCKRLFDLAAMYRTGIESTDTRDMHVGESDYSSKAIQPWDVWIEYYLNPWDADLVKRTIRTKKVPGLSPKEARIQDYKKIQHIAQERIDQINAGEPWYRKFKMPTWVTDDE